MHAFIDTYQWLITSGTTKPLFEDNKKWLDEEIKELKDAIIANDESEMYNAVADAVWILANFAYFNGLEIGRLSLELDRVRKSNFTKFCKTEEEAIESVEAYKNGTHPNKIGSIIDAYYVKNDEYYIIKRKDDNKILKSINFKDVNKF